MITIKIEGLSELDRKLREFGPKIAANGLRAADFAGAAVFRDAAKATVPVKTGLLQAQLYASRRRTPNYIAEYTVLVKNKAKLVPVARRARTAKNIAKGRVGKYHQIAGPAIYGRFLEFGTSKMAARPFLRPAFLNNIDRAISAIRDRFAKAVVDAAK